MPTQDKGQLFIRITTEAETRQQKIYQALGIAADGLGKKKTTVENKWKICSANFDRQKILNYWNAK